MRMPERVWKIKKLSGSETQDLGVTIFHTRVKNNLNSKNEEKKLARAVFAPHFEGHRVHVPEKTLLDVQCLVNK